MKNIFLYLFIFSAFNSCHIFFGEKKDKDLDSSIQKKSSPSEKTKGKTIHESVEQKKSIKTDPSFDDLKLKSNDKMPQKQRVKKPVLSSKTKKSKPAGSKSNCNLSDRSQKKINSYIVSLTDNFLKDEDIEELLGMHLGDIQKGWPHKCPQNCQAVNDYSILAKVYPLSIVKNSCNKEEAKELYQINKIFSVNSSGKEAKKKLYKIGGDWIFSVFIKPFIPFSRNLPKEVAENKIKTACPSCSFYLDYIYKYTTDNQLNLSATAHCGPKRTLFSKFKSDFFLVNQWKCIKKE